MGSNYITRRSEVAILEDMAKLDKKIAPLLKRRRELAIELDAAGWGKTSTRDRRRKPTQGDTA